MPMKLSIGLSRKVGQPNFGSHAASCSVEFEVEGSMLQANLETFHHHVRNGFAACEKAVEDELARHEANPQPEPQRSQGNGERGQARQATSAQVRAILAIGHRQRADISQLVNDRFQVGRPEDLSVQQASQLIDELKGASNDNGDRR